MRHTRSLDLKSYCISLDPGGTTGIALVEQEEHPWEVAVKQLGPDEHHDNLLDFLRVWRPRYIVCESFQNRSFEAAKLIAPEYIGVVKLYTQDSTNRPVDIVWQSAALGKGFWDNNKLRAYNLYIPGMRHARDAIRHYAYWRTFTLHDRSVLEGTIRPRVFGI